MIYTDICHKCGHEEDDIRSVARKRDQPVDDFGVAVPCASCGSSSWKVVELYVPTRCWGLKGENENFPLKSHLKGSDGKRIVFNNKRAYEDALSSRGLAIAGNNPIGAPPEAKATPSKALESHPTFKKMKDMEKKGLIDTKPKFIPKEEVESELG